MGLFEILNGSKTKIEELQSRINYYIRDKKRLKTIIDTISKENEIYKTEVYNIEILRKENNKKIEELQSEINTLLQDNKRFEKKINALSKEIDTYKKKVNDMEESTKHLSFYKDRFGNIPFINNLSEEGCLSEYDRDKSFFDRIEKIKGNPFNNDQIEAVRYPCEKHMRLIAGAGSGKTETICAKAAYLVTMENIDESKICMITFTRKAAREMEDRVNQFLSVDKSNIMIGTFHSVFIRLFNILVKRFPAFENYGIHGDDPEKGQLDYVKTLKKLIKKYDLYNFDKLNDKNIQDRISYWINMGYSIDDMVNNIERHFDVEIKTKTGQKLSEQFKVMMQEFESIRRRENIVVYDDYLLNLYNILNEYPEARNYLQGKFDYIFIDEFQDTNQLQMNIISLLCPNDNGTSTKLIIVGDDDQSIYAFRGSDPIYIKNFDENYSTKTFELMTNYRSKEDIVTAGNRLIINNKHDRIQKSMEPFHDNKGEAFTVELEDIYKEADWIIDKIEKLGMETPFTKESDKKKTKSELPNYTRSVIIYRSVSQLQGMIRTLDSKNTPYVIENKDDLLGIFNIQEFKNVFDIWNKFFNSTDHKNLIFSWKKILINTASNYFIKAGLIDEFIESSNTDNLNKMIEMFNAFVSNNTNSFNDTKYIEPYLKLLYDLKNGISIKITDIIERLFEFPKIKANLSKEDLDYIHKECETYNTWNELEGYYKRLEEKKKEMKHKLKQYFAKEYNALYLLTIHKSKGLAFDNVFVIGCYDRGIPAAKAVALCTINIDECKQKAEPPTTIEEERRLMYVAVTRARQNLYVTFPSTIQDKPCARSRFIKDLHLPFLK